MIFYQYETRNNLRLCVRYKLVRILTDGETLYAWNVEEAEHKEVRAKLHLSDEFVGFFV